MGYFVPKYHGRQKQSNHVIWTRVKPQQRISKEPSAPPDSPRTCPQEVRAAVRTDRHDLHLPASPTCSAQALASNAERKQGSPVHQRGCPVFPPPILPLLVSMCCDFSPGREARSSSIPASLSAYALDPISSCSPRPSHLQVFLFLSVFPTLQDQSQEYTLPKKIKTFRLMLCLFCTISVPYITAKQLHKVGRTHQNPLSPQPTPPGFYP